MEVYDIDDMNKKDELDKQEFIGSLKFTLHELVA